MEDAFTRLLEAEISQLRGEGDVPLNDACRVGELRAAFEDAVDKFVAETTALADADARSSAFCEGLGKLLQIFWRRPVNGIPFSGLSPASLDGSVALKAMGATLAKICSVDAIAHRAYIQESDIMAWTLAGMAVEDDELVSCIIPLLDWFANEVVAKRWGVENVWTCCTHNRGNEPLAAAAKVSGPALLSFLVDGKGCPVQGVLSEDADYCPLAEAFWYGNVVAFDWLLEHGASPFATYKEGMPVGVYIFRHLQGHNGDDDTPLPGILLERRSAMLLKLIEEYGLFDGWSERYKHKWRGHIAQSLADIAVSAYPRNPDFEGSDRIMYNPKASRILDLVFSKGWTWNWSIHNCNALLSRLYPGAKQPCFLIEDDCLDLLSRYRRAGADVASFLSESHAKHSGTTLIYWAANTGQTKVIDFAIEQCGCDVDCCYYSSEENHCILPLLVAMIGSQTHAALTLLRKHRAQACYPDLRAADQPITTALAAKGLSDDDSEAIIRALIERNPSFLNIECFKGARVEVSPVEFACRRYKPRCLKLLLASGLPNVKELSTHLWVNLGGRDWRRIPVALVAAHLKSWDCLEVLIAHTDARVTETMDGWTCAAELVFRATHDPNPPSRALVALVLAKAKKEKENAKSQPAMLGVAAAIGKTTNSFEEGPASGTGGSDSRQQTRRTQRKRGRKKKKGPRTASAGAGSATAARGDEEDSSGDEDDDEPFEEPDDNLVDSRFAPSLDVMFAAMGFPPGGPTAVPAGPASASTGDDE